MRKLFWVSLLAAAGMLYGCGYGDGKDLDDNTIIDDNNNKNGPLIRLSATCTSNLECMDKDSHTVIGDCIAGECRRFCNDTRDCEKNTVCEGGICQPVVDCPKVAFIDSAKDSQYEKRKCIKVFNISPSVAWSKLLTEDLVFSNENKELFGKATDFTSNNYAFELPQTAIDSGVNFSMITYLAVNYLKLELIGAAALAQCTKPQIKKGENEYTDIPDYSYKASYTYSLSNDPITKATMMSICDGATYHMDDDMDKYYEYLTTEGRNCASQSDDASKMKCVIKNYTEMIENKSTCNLARKSMEIIKVFSNSLMTAGKTSATSSTSYKGADEIYKWLNNKLALQYIYSSDFDKSDTNAESGAHKFDLECTDAENKKCILGIYPIKLCDYNSWTENMTKNNDLRRNSSSDEQYKNSQDRIRFCNEEDVIMKTDPESPNSNTATFNNKKYYFDPDEAFNINMKMLKEHAMKSQLGTCIYMMDGTYDFKLMKAMAKSEDIKLLYCGIHSSLKESTVNASYITDNTSSVDNMIAEQYNNIFNLMEMLKVLANDFNSGELSTDSKALLANIESIQPESLASLTSLESLYKYTTDPSYIWLPGDSKFPLVINTINEAKNSNSDYSFLTHDLILDFVYQPATAIFTSDPTSRIPLAGNVTFSSYQDSYINVVSDDSEVEDDSDSEVKYELNDNAHTYVSTFTYSNNAQAESHATVLYQKDENLGSKGCPNNRCTFYWDGHRTGDSGMICGGVTFIVDHIDGYIVTKPADIFGNRDIVSEDE